MNKVFIIAEAGVNHNGSIKLAKELVEIAKVAGADAVKFQTFKAQNVVTKTAKKASYQIKSNTDLESQFDMIKKLELTEDEHIELFNYCKLLNIEFMSTPFDMESIDFLSNLGINKIKIPSGEITNLPYLIKIAKLGLPTIMSTGMCNINEIEEALNILMEYGLSKNKITILHCNTQYPTPYEDVNLRAMNTIKETFNVNVGYSDHTLGTEVSISAVAMGAIIIEKHFTISKNLKGPDHLASLEPSELITMIKAIRNIELALGSNCKVLTTSESENLHIARRSIHISKNMKKGEVIRELDLSIKRPGSGISPMFLNKVIGKKLSKDVEEDHLLTWDDLN
jgi:N,N'-diacetyllegionaminate synthase